jgi:hypothetical protein
MVIPYFSIDLFFAAAPLLCADRRELKTFATRIFLAITIAGTIFMLFPLRLELTRPPTHGIPGMLFTLLNSFDRPYNLAPSLHITLRSILWIVYVRHTRGVTRTLVKTWFILIGLSTLLTWQHHVFDVVTGQILAMAIIYAVPEQTAALRRARRLNPNGLLPGGLGVSPERSRRPAVSRRSAQPLGQDAQATKLGRRYALGCLALLAASFFRLPWSLALLWPALALALVAAAYFRFGAAIFRKTADGRLDAATRFVLGPYLLGMWATRLWHHRRTNAWSRLTSDLIIGRRPTRAGFRALAAEGVTAILDLTAESARARSPHAIVYANVPMLDLVVPPPTQVRACLRFIEKHTADGGTFYIYCGLGCWRSAIVAAAYLTACGRARDAQEAIDVVRTSRPCAVFNADAIQAIDAFARSASPPTRSPLAVAGAA